MTEEVRKFHCKGKLPNGDACPEMVTYEYNPIPGLLKVDRGTEEVVYLTCNNDHCFPYEIST